MGSPPTWTGRSELELAAAARAGSDAAWEALYDRAYPKLQAYARRRLPSAAHAEDAVAETMARAVAGIGTWTGEGAGFLPWLYGILRHVVVDVQRSSWRECPATDPDLHGTAADQAVDGEPLGRLVVAEERERLRAAFARLKPGERAVLELRVLAGLDADEAAAVLGRRAGAVRMAQSRALAHLRRLLEVDVDRRDAGRPDGDPCTAAWASPVTGRGGKRVGGPVP